jgi:hypothetical protein
LATFDSASESGPMIARTAFSGQSESARWSWAFPLITIVAACIYGAMFFYYSYQTRILRPYSDLIDLIDYYFRAGSADRIWSYLFEPHGEYHRIVWLRLLVAADVGAFKGGGLSFVASAALAFFGVAALLAREVSLAATAKIRLSAVALTLMVVLLSANAADLSVPASTSYPQTVVFAVLAIILATPQPGGSGRRVAALRASALACACGAAFGNAVGLVIWPVLAFSAWRAGGERTWLLTVVLTGVLFVAAYVPGNLAPDSANAVSFDALPRALDYFFAYLGLPWVRASGAAGRLLGVFLFAGAMTAVFRAGGAGSTRASRLGLAMVLFSLGTAAMAALGRSGETALVDVPVRYTLLLAPLHVGLLLLALPWLERMRQAKPFPFQAAFVSLLIGLLVQQVLVGQVAGRAAERTRLAISRFEQGQRTPDMPALVHPDLEHAAAIEAEIRRRGLYRVGHGGG